MSSPPADADFIATCYEILLGRELESLDVVRDRAGWPRIEVVRSIVGSSEFMNDVLPALQTGLPFLADRFKGSPSLRQRLWAADSLGLDPKMSVKVRQSETWRDLLCSIEADHAFATSAGWPEPW